MKIDFPEEEIPELSKRHTIITHRVLDDFDKFKLNDIVTTAWGKEFKVTGRKVIDSVNDSPFMKDLTGYQYEFLKKFDKIAVLRLESNINPKKREMHQIFHKVIDAYKKLGFDLSYMEIRIDTQPLYTNGRICLDIDPDLSGGNWTKLGFIRINPDMTSVMKKYGIKYNNANDISQFCGSIIAHELAHELYNNNSISNADKEHIIDKCADSGFTTVYLKTVPMNKRKQETFCEYMSKLITDEIY